MQTHAHMHTLTNSCKQICSFPRSTSWALFKWRDELYCRHAKLLQGSGDHLITNSFKKVFFGPALTGFLEPLGHFQSSKNIRFTVFLLQFFPNLLKSFFYLSLLFCFVKIRSRFLSWSRKVDQKMQSPFIPNNCSSGWWLQIDTPVWLILQDSGDIVWNFHVE